MGLAMQPPRYSDMPDFYDKAGWIALSATDVILSSNPWLRDIQGAYADLEVQLLSNMGIEELCTRDIEMLKVAGHKVDCWNRSIDGSANRRYGKVSTRVRRLY